MKPILFNTEMVRAILDGKKTQTRRIVKVQPPDHRENWRLVTLTCSTDRDDRKNIGKHRWARLEGINILDDTQDYFKPLCYEGDILWVRETWQINPFYEFIYRATDVGFDKERFEEGWKWKPSLFMPKEACRLFLKVTNVRVQRLQDMNMGEIIAEGVDYIEKWDTDDVIMSKWIELWDSINLKRGFGWDTNPWVWVYEFEKTDRPKEWPR